MPTLSELSRELNLSKDGLRRRLAILKAHGVDGFARGGAHGAIVIPENVAEVIRRAVALERAEGVPMRRALIEVLGKRKDATPPALEPAAPTSAPSADLGGRSAPTSAGLDPRLEKILWTLTAVLATGVAGGIVLGVLALQARGR